MAAPVTLGRRHRPPANSAAAAVTLLASSAQQQACQRHNRVFSAHQVSQSAQKVSQEQQKAQLHPATAAMLHQPALGGVKRGIKGPEIHRSAAAPSRRARRRCTVVTAASAAGPGVGGTPAKPLVVVGSVNADLVLCVDRLPQPGETLGARSLAFHPGGKVRACVTGGCACVVAAARPCCKD